MLPVPARTGSPTRTLRKETTVRQLRGLGVQRMDQAERGLRRLFFSRRPSGPVPLALEHLPGGRPRIVGCWASQAQRPEHRHPVRCYRSYPQPVRRLTQPLTPTITQRGEDGGRTIPLTYFPPPFTENDRIFLPLYAATSRSCAPPPSLLTPPLPPPQPSHPPTPPRASPPPPPPPSPPSSTPSASPSNPNTS